MFTLSQLILQLVALYHKHGGRVHVISEAELDCMLVKYIEIGKKAAARQ